MKEEQKDKQGVFVYDSCLDCLVPLNHQQEEEEAYRLHQQVKDPTR